MNEDQKIVAKAKNKAFRKSLKKMIEELDKLEWSDQAKKFKTKDLNDRQRNRFRINQGSFNETARKLQRIGKLYQYRQCRSKNL